MNKIKLIIVTFLVSLFLPTLIFAVTPRECIQICVDRGGTPYACAADCNVDTGRETGIFGNIEAPEALANFGTVEGGAVGNFLNIIFKVIVVGAGIFVLFNLLTAGYAFMSAGDDPKKVAGAWQKIWQSLLGLAFTAGAFVLAAIFGQLIFGRADFILNPSIPTP